MRNLLSGTLLWAATAGLGACKNDQGLKELKFQAIGVSTGDFDQVEASLVRQDIGYTPYEGYIVQAAYDPTIKPSANSLKVEDLFTRSEGNDPEIDRYDAVFVNSGTRGLGAYVYNGTAADDSLVSDPTVIENVRNYVENGGTLVVSDWAYDLIEACWPDEITWAGDDTVLDDAQRGTSGSVVANVDDLSLQEGLDNNTTLDITFDYSAWAVISTVASDVTTYVSGDVTYRISDAVGDGTATDVPLLVGFDPSGGHVLFSSFHWRAQRSQVTDGILTTLIDGLTPGSGDATGSDTGTSGSDTGTDTGGGS